MKTLLLIGATSAIAHECARLWLKDNYKKIILVGRNLEKLRLVAADLKTRSANKVETSIQIADFNNCGSIQTVMNSILSDNTVDTALIAHGVLIENAKVINIFEKLSKECNVTAMSPVLFLETIVSKMQSQGYGHIGIIGSVAGDRGRLTNYVYGSCKSFIHTYVQGVQHKLKNENSKVSVTLIKPGPTKSPMTASLPNADKCADVTLVAKQIVNAVNKGKLTVYTPKKWWMIMLIIKHLPMFIFRKLKI